MLKETGGLANGGFTNLPNDHGGATKYGLSLRYLIAQGKLDPSFVDQADLNHDGVLDLPDIEDMTLATAAPIYGQFFWTAPGFDSLPPTFDAALFDEGVNGGTVTASKLLQSALNALWRTSISLEALVVDGGLGQITRGRLALSISQKGAAATLSALRSAVASRDRAIVASDPSQQEFLDGWLNRAAELGDV